MVAWRYIALDRAGGGRGARRTGRIEASTIVQARAALRGEGMQVIDVRPARRRDGVSAGDRLIGAWRDRWHRHLRARRAAARAEMLDGLATLMNAGVPLHEAIGTLAHDEGSPGAERGMEPRRGPAASMLALVHERLKSGASLALAAGEHPDWFDPIDVAVIEAGQHAGTLPQAMAAMAERSHEGDELRRRLIGSLAYPMLVLLVAVAVSMFLSVRTLPQVAALLQNARVPVPKLTVAVMACGRFLVDRGFIIALALPLACLAAIGLGSIVPRLDVPALAPIRAATRRLRRGLPEVGRTLAAGDLSLRLSLLLRSGVAAVESLRIAARAAGSKRFAAHLRRAADDIERGEELSAAMSDPDWFDPEYRRLLDIGQASGELPDLLEQIGRRLQRRAKRRMDRLTRLLEPAAILLLAALVGTVVMAAILPLARLRDIL